ncbi:piercer of microtubule wall 2 protein-like [Clarias gariepinus]|uniref:piercer of microtubule wall 2 protein n=1 Tax=Clarias gariepinus TaxID=13013 RepID=UPI00234C1FAF|nr:piercer of microtubule wall 2 protein [Clarias gariepinus]
MSRTGEHQCAPCANLGNPVFSCTMKLSSSSGPKLQSLLYRTTSGQYGSRPPTFESSPCVYYPQSQAFSEHLALCGMPRDTAFNTSLDRSRVCDCLNLHNTI